MHSWNNFFLIMGQLLSVKVCNVIKAHNFLFKEKQDATTTNIQVVYLDMSVFLFPN
jgi:ACT domain-containing protein